MVYLLPRWHKLFFLSGHHDNSFLQVARFILFHLFHIPKWLILILILTYSLFPTGAVGGGVAAPWLFVLVPTVPVRTSTLES